MTAAVQFQSLGLCSRFVWGHRAAGICHGPNLPTLFSVLRWQIAGTADSAVTAPLYVTKCGNSLRSNSPHLVTGTATAEMQFRTICQKSQLQTVLGALARDKRRRPCVPSSKTVQLPNFFMDSVKFLTWLGQGRNATIYKIEK